MQKKHVRIICFNQYLTERFDSEVVFPFVEKKANTTEKA